MSNSIIEVNNLSKSYTISHEGRERYTALRDVMAQKAKKIFSFPKSLTSSSTKEEFWALKDVNFNIEQGDRVGIIGRNGAGKSTLLKILSRITEPTAGEIKIRGRVASLLEVGTGFHPELTGRENIFLNGAILGMSRMEIKKHFDAIVDFAEVEKFLDTPVKRYSSGMYVRLAFAVAAHLEPEILVVDEVLAVGDAQFQKKCLGKMEDVSKNEGRTVLFVSHNLGAITQLCKKGILLHQGQVIRNDSIQKVLSSYQELEKDNSGKSYTNKTPNEFQIISVSYNLPSASPFFTFSDEVSITIDVKLPKNIEGLSLGVVVIDKWKRKIFTTVHCIYKKHDEDDNRFLVRIPSHLLLAGLYTLDVATFIPNGTVFQYLNDICPFELEDTESDMAVFGQADVGVINVKCKWE